MLNPGSAPIDDASEDHAAANIAAFAAAVRDHGLEVGEPARDPDADDGGRFGWVLRTADGAEVRVLMPGVPLERVQAWGDSAPCLKVGAEWWWWASAVTVAAGALR